MASLCMTVLFVICRDWFLFCDFYSADEEYEEFKRVFKSSIKHEFASIDDGSKRLIESIEDEIKPLKIKLMYYPILMINQIKMMIFLDFYIPYLKRETSFAIMREMRMEEFRSFLYYVTNIENFFEKIFYSCFISTKIILTSSYASILFVILDSNYLFDLSFLEIALDTNTEYHERRRAFFKDFDEGYYKENIFKNFKSNQSTITPKSQLLTFTDDLDDLDTVIDDDQKNSV
ncbi:16257_t:CDS:2 [Rhizophagus irregularis]|nr:16257_t:CDS:2 [Rhizophagus irregularis]